jgi:hypothetical protein
MFETAAQNTPAFVILEDLDRAFPTEGNRHTLMPRGFTHEDGWFDILWRVCGNAQSHRARLLTFEPHGCPEFERE